MSNETFVTIATFFCLGGTLFGGIIALFGQSNFVQRLAQTIILISLGAGTAAAGIFLINNLAPLIIFDGANFFTGKLVLDQLSAIFFFLVNCVGLLTMLYGVKYILNEKHHYNIAYVQCLSALFILGMQLVVIATTPIFFLFAWELMSFSSFLLVMADFKISSIRPALFYLIITHLGAGAILAGFLFISAGVITVDFTQLAQMAGQLSPGMLIATFSLFFFGFGSKAGLFPFHGWLPEAHPQAPSHISALMSGIMLKIAVYGLLRVTLFILPVLPIQLGFVVVTIGLFSAIFGVLYSVIETDIKRILAFSSIENLGLIFAMIGVYLVAKNLNIEVLAQTALIAALYQSICHAFFKSGLFLSAGIAGQAFHTRNIEKMGGMAKHMRLFSFCVLLLSLSAAALPPSGTFIGEWMILQSIINNISTVIFPVRILLLITLITFAGVAGMAVFSMVRFFGLAFLASPRTAKAQIDKDPVAELLIPVILLGFSAFLLGSISPQVISIIGHGFLSPSSPAPIFTMFGSFFNPAILLALLFIVILLGYLFKRISSNNKNERPYHTWDCGQPIDASMEYTATAFSSPMRFFFAQILRSNDKISVKPLLSTNHWLVKKSIKIEIKPIWDQYFYNPVVRLITFCSTQIRRIQNGNIQFYITLILISLIISAIITL